AMATTRAREVGIRTVVGARRGDLIGQFLGESLLLSFFGLAIALLLLYLLLPAFNHIAGKSLSMGMALDPLTIFGFLSVTILAAILAGSYPAFYLTGMRPQTAIQGKVITGTTGAWGKRLRSGLVVFQFFLSIVLILATIAIVVQMRYIRNKDLGFDHRNLLSLHLNRTCRGEYASLKMELLRHPAVLGVTADWQNPMNISSTVTALEWEGKNPNETLSMHFDWVDYDYFETLKIPVALGRTFSPAFAADEAEGYIVNEAAVRMMGMVNPVGQNLSVFRKPGRIIGVVRDFHFQPLRHRIHPIVFMLRPTGGQHIMIRFNPAATAQALQHIGDTFKQFDPEQAAAFQYSFFDQQMMQLGYDFEAKIQAAALLFTILALLIACAGLFALAAFLTQQRTKEVGIRKVLGASAGQISYLLSKEFSAWVVLANLFAWPVAYFLNRQLFTIYAYHADIGIQYYLFAGLVTFVIAASTAGLLTMRSASANPVRALRYE
ncbi:FtsX-like permease family protein, partial [candidate division KSB1 bacterium]|nr:FtsX-like permease family protein [candidate division KSB1 bacterium]